MVFEPHPQSEARRRSAVTLIKHLLADKSQKCSRPTIANCSAHCFWKITGADGHKYKTRFQSQGAMGCTDTAKLRHEHVFQRSRMIEALENASPHEVDDILKNAIGCTLTIEECPRSMPDKFCSSWSNGPREQILG
jgi:hypothetical protein